MTSAFYSLNCTKRPNSLLSKDRREEADDSVGTIHQFRLVKTMADVQRVFSKHKPATKTLSVEEREGAQASIFRILQQEQFAEEMKSLKTEKEILNNSKIFQFFLFIDQQGLIRATCRIGKSQLNFKTKHPILSHWKHLVVELFLQNEHKNSHHEGTEHVRNIVQ